METITNSPAIFCSSTAQPAHCKRPRVCSFSSSEMSAAVGPKEARTDTNAGVKKSGKTSKPYDSYLLRYQELKHMKESRNPPRNQQNLRRNEQYTQDDSNGEMPQINEELDNEKGSKGRRCKTKLCVLL